MLNIAGGLPDRSFSVKSYAIYAIREKKIPFDGHIPNQNSSGI